MRILYVSQYFPPEMGAPSARVHELSREWVRAGHDVTVLTAFAHHPVGIKAPGDRWRITRRETLDGIDVIRTYVYATPNKGTFRRMASYASFMCSSAVIGTLRARRPDVVIATSPQLLCAVSGYCVARILRAPFVFEVRDLWPESLLANNAVRDGSFIGVLRRVSRFLYNRSERIVTVGAGYRDEIVDRYGISREKIGIVHNGVDRDLFTPQPRDNPIRRERGWGERFVVLYLGTHGISHGLNFILDIARRMRGDDGVRFVLTGEGAEKDRLEAEVRRDGLTNVEFLSQQPKDRVAQLYAACDIGIVSLLPAPLFQRVLPSKLFEYFAMERPVVVAIDGDARRLTESAGAGWYVPYGDLDAAVETIQSARRQPEKLREMGCRGRRFVLENFDRAVLAREYLNLLQTVASVGR